MQSYSNILLAGLNRDQNKEEKKRKNHDIPIACIYLMWSWSFYSKKWCSGLEWRRKWEEFEMTGGRISWLERSRFLKIYELNAKCIPSLELNPAMQTKPLPTMYVRYICTYRVYTLYIAHIHISFLKNIITAILQQYTTLTGTKAIIKNAKREKAHGMVSWRKKKNQKIITALFLLSSSKSESCWNKKFRFFPIPGTIL